MRLAGMRLCGEIDLRKNSAALSRDASSDSRGTTGPPGR